MANTNESAPNAETSVSMARVSYTILKNWRKVLRNSILLAVIFGVVSAGVNLIHYNNKSFIEEEQSDYEIALTAYETKGQTLQSDILNLRTSLKEQTNYNKNSILMQIDPYNKYVATFVYYIDTGYQIMPEYVYQNADYGQRLVQMYTSYLTGGEMYAKVAESSSPQTEVRYIEETFNIKPNFDTNMISIQVCSTSEENCREIINLIKEGMNAKYAEAAKSIGEHTLTELNEYIYTTVDLELEKQQKENIQSLTEMNESLETKIEEYKTWKKQTVPRWGYSGTAILKSAVKLFLIGGVVGILVSAVILSVQYVSSGRVTGLAETRSRLRLSALGTLPRQPARKELLLDRLAANVGAVSLRYADRNKLAAAAAKNICAMLGAETASVALAGDVPPADLEATVAALADTDGEHAKITFSFAGNPMTDPAAAEIVQAANAVVLVLRQGKSTYSEAEEILTRLVGWRGKILGFILTDADARA